MSEVTQTPLKQEPSVTIKKAKNGYVVSTYSDTDKTWVFDNLNDAVGTIEDILGGGSLEEESPFKTREVKKAAEETEEENEE